MIKLSNTRPMSIYKLAELLVDLVCRKCELWVENNRKCPSQRCWLIEAKAEIKREAKEKKAKRSAQNG